METKSKKPTPKELAVNVNAELLNALRVLTLAPITRAWLATNDPQALHQASLAIAKAEGRA
jgi:hypothetical protein